MFNKLLIANRGEIACRIIKTAKRLGITTVAIYSTIDRDSLHVTLADEAYCIGDAAAKTSYLNIEAIINAATLSQAQAIHPGYGFLSENAAFARACAQANIIFVGPSINALDIMGSKQQAKQLLETKHVPLTPGYHGLNQSDEHLLKEAKKIGFPVLLKAANGGGGKGMRAVHHEKEFKEALLGARREARAYFNDELMLIEKLIETPRHIEVQLMADNHGHIVHLFERDCSLQRRHQKIIEEAPAPSLDDKIKQTLFDAAIDVAKAIDYRGAGTVEFLVANDNIYFMEMNTRLQVEHPVTEMITGLDLVEWQLRIAANEPLPASQEELQVQGHAIECRICAEDPEHDFLPSTGTIDYLKEPIGHHIRIDTGIRAGDSISQYYDPMIAKLITHGRNREEAIHRMQQALSNYALSGVKTNIVFLQAILQTSAFLKAELNTHFLNNIPIVLKKPDERIALMMAASMDYLKASHAVDPLHAETFGFQMNVSTHWTTSYRVNDAEHTLIIHPLKQNSLTIEAHAQNTTLHLTHENDTIRIDTGKARFHARVLCLSNGYTFFTPHGPITVTRKNLNDQALEKNTQEHHLNAPMPATVVALLKQKGDHVQAGEGLMVLEAMKMEHTILAPENGQLIDIYYAIGAQVPEGAQLVEFKPTGP